jgi:hypothetical protein
VDTAGVVADHAAKGAAIVSGGIGAKGQVIFLGGVAKMIENNSGLHACDAARRIDLENLGHVLREIEDDGDIAALPGKRSSSTAAEQWRAEITTESDRRENVIRIAGKNNSDRDLTIVRSVGCIKSAALIVEADVTAEMLAQGFG